MALNRAKTYVYIDVSNIRYACSFSLGFRLNFVKLYEYFKQKYPNLQDVRYYEGVAKGDERKRYYLNFLHNEVGYTIRTLDRKTYIQPRKMKTFICEKCGFRNHVVTLRSSIKMKSNVDVFLTVDMLENLSKQKGRVNIVIVSSDGDYAEAIKSAVRMNSKVYVTVLATPRTRIRNTFSTRLADLERELPRSNYRLSNIKEISDLIKI